MTEKKSTDVIGEFVEMMEIFLNPSHPEHEAVKQAYPEAALDIANMMHMAQANADIYKQADHMADLLTGLAERCDTEDFVSIFPDQGMGLTVLSLIAKNNRLVKAKKDEAQKIFNERQSKNASAPRPGRQHPKKAEVLIYWKKWQADQKIYESKAAFIRDMLEKMEMNRVKTIEKWIAEWGGT